MTDDKKGKMIKVTVGGHTYGMHDLLVENLNIMKDKSKEDHDFKLLISGDGMTRTGKTTLAAQIAKYLDPESTEKHWCHKGDELINLSLSLGPSRVIIYDEALEGLDNKDTMGKYSKTIYRHLTKCGWLNQYIIIILPEYFDLLKRVAINISMALLNVHFNNQMERGYFEFFNRPDKKMLYIKGKKFLDYKAHKCSFRGQFGKYYPYDYNLIQDMKAKSYEETDEEEKKVSGLYEPTGKREIKYKQRWLAVINYLYFFEQWPKDRIVKAISQETDPISSELLRKIIEGATARQQGRKINAY